MLAIDRDEESGEQADVVIAFEHILRPIAQLTISDQEVQAAAREVDRMDTRNAAGGQLGANSIERPLPARTGNG